MEQEDNSQWRTSRLKLQAGSREGRKRTIRGTETSSNTWRKRGQMQEICWLQMKKERENQRERRTAGPS